MFFNIVPLIMEFTSSLNNTLLEVSPVIRQTLNG
jgi:hypothetical protein